MASSLEDCLNPLCPDAFQTEPNKERENNQTNNVLERSDEVISYVLLHSVITGDVELTRNLIASECVIFSLEHSTVEEINANVITGEEFEKQYASYQRNRLLNSAQISLIEVVCLSENYSDKCMMLEILIKSKISVDIEALCSTICNPLCSDECRKLLIENYLVKFLTSNDYWSVRKKVTLVTVLENIISCLWIPGNMKFLISVIETILISYSVADSEISDWLITLSFGLRKAIEMKCSTLLSLFLNKHQSIVDSFNGEMGHEISNGSEWYASMFTGRLMETIQHQAYYCMHLLCKWYSTGPAGRNQSADFALAVAARQCDLFATLYLVNVERRRTIRWLNNPENGSLLYLPVVHLERNCLLFWLLCTRGENVNDMGNWGESLISLLARNNSTLSVALVLNKYGADVNKHREGIGLSALLHAVKHHNLDIVRRCLRANCVTELVFMDERTGTPITPASLALHWGHYDTLQMLLVAGARIPHNCRSRFQASASRHHLLAVRVFSPAAASDQHAETQSTVMRGTSRGNIVLNTRSQNNLAETNEPEQENIPNPGPNDETVESIHNRYRRRVLNRTLSEERTQELCKEWVATWVQAPIPLKYQCRRFIRRLLGKRMDEGLAALRYPQALKQFITTERLF